MNFKEAVEVRNWAMAVVGSKIDINTKIGFGLNRNIKNINSELEEIIEVENKINEIRQQYNSDISELVDESGKVLEGKEEEVKEINIKVNEEVAKLYLQRDELLECECKVDLYKFDIDGLPEVMPANMTDIPELLIKE